MSSFTPSSPEPSKCTATNVIPTSANRSHSAMMAAFAAAFSGGSACSRFDALFSMGLSFRQSLSGSTPAQQKSESFQESFMMKCEPPRQSYAHTNHPGAVRLRTQKLSHGARPGHVVRHLKAEHFPLTEVNKVEV